MKKTITFLFLCSFFLSNAQTKIDSLKTLLDKTKSESEIIILSDDITRKLLSKQEIKEYKEYIKVLNKYTVKNQNIKSLIYKLKGNLARFQGKVDSAQFYFIKGAKLVNKKHVLFADNNLNIGNKFLVEGKLNDAIYHYKLAEETYLLNSNIKGTCLSLINISIINLNQFNFYDSEQNLLKGLKLNEKLQNKYISAKSHQLIGHIQMVIGNWEHSLKNLEKASEIFKKSNDTFGVLETNSSIAEHFLLKKQFDKAKIYIDKSIDIIKEKSIPPNPVTVIVFGTYIEILINLKQISLAEIYLKKSLKHLDAIEYEIYRPYIIINKANIFYQKGLYIKSLSKLKEIENQDLNEEQKLKLLNLKRKIFKKLKQFNEFVTFNSKYQELKNKFSDERMRKNFIYTQEKFESQQKENEILKLSNENIKKKAEAKTKSTQLTYSLFGGGAILLLSLFTLRAYRKEKKSKEQVALQKQEIETLHKEVHHRVKNNLAVAKSFTSIAKENVHDKKGKEALNALQSRIDSMANVHEILYKQDNISAVNFQSYTERICEEISKAFDGENRNINCFIDANIQIPINEAIPLGLILNEAVTNSFKYAFKGKGNISIQISEENNEIKCTISDNGVGMPKGFNMEELNSYGMELIQTLAMQLEGSLEIKNQNGTQINITIPKN